MMSIARPTGCSPAFVWYQPPTFLICGNALRDARCTLIVLAVSLHSVTFQDAGMLPPTSVDGGSSTSAGSDVDRYFAVTQRTALLCTIWARPFSCLPVILTAVPRGTSLVWLAPVEELHR